MFCFNIELKLIYELMFCNSQLFVCGHIVAVGRMMTKNRNKKRKNEKKKKVRLVL